MAIMLFDPPNFLVLDEPTNHLDMATKEMLIEALAQYEGTMLFVSHDRHFLAALSNRVLELTPEGVHSYGGGYTGVCRAHGARGARVARLKAGARGGIDRHADAPIGCLPGAPGTAGNFRLIIIVTYAWSSAAQVVQSLEATEPPV